MVEKTYPCDLCDHVPFKAPTALGRHKLSAHGIPGKSTSSLAYRKAREKEKNFNGKHRARTHHESKEVHTTRTLAGSKKPALQKIQRQIEFDIPEGALAVAFGRFQELCRSFAFEYDLPPKLLTTRLSQFISASALR